MSIISTVPKGAAVEGINPNLLRNWYFIGGGTGRGVFPVNSRGLTSFSTGQAIDGWIGGNLYSNLIQLLTNGILINSSVQNYQDIHLLVEGTHNNEFYGKTLTISALFSDSVLWKATATIAPTTSNGTLITVGDSTFSVFLYGNSNLLAFYLRALAGSNSKIVVAAKLELGDQQTLAHQENGVWVLNEIPDYEEEYYRCVTSDADSTDTYANQKVSNITVQCNSVGSSSLRYYNKLIQSTHKVLDSTFSNPAAQTSNITVTTYDGYLDFSNGFASGATTNITLVLGTSGPVLSTTTTAPS